MKRAILFLMIMCAMVFMVISCEKGTEPDDNDNNHSDSTDNAVPYISFWNPEDGESSVSIAASLYVSICDTGEFASGLISDSITMTVNGVSVNPTIITNTCGGYDLRYINPINFDYNTDIEWCIDAVDTSGNALHDCAEFTTEENLDTCSFSIDTLAPLPGFLTRSRPTGMTVQALYFPTLGSSYNGLSGGAPYSVKFTPNRSWILSDKDDDIWVINLTSGVQYQLTTHSMVEKYPDLSPDGRTLAFARAGDIVLKNLFDDSEHVLVSSSQGGKNLRFSADSSYLAYTSGVSYNPLLYIWDLSDESQIAHPGLDDDVDCFAWSSTGSEIAVVSQNHLYYWDVEAGSFPVGLHAATDLDHVVFSPAGDWIYFIERNTALGDKIYRAWPGQTMELVNDLTGENATIEAITISEDGNTLLYSKYRGGAYSLCSYDISSSSETVLTSSIGQTLQLEWY